ncbi:FAD:protein FMN transferase [Christensenella tenuis]|jgi:FAD:protein FMN transferase|uniref:FAD:protein FMN transferase n=1 Tax=Christensenella tenuis TaxID=2763033 RepID=A0ABR7EES2_9FIRM|nr:FAD:protein FMN transferase [Christensenella tenuis]MBC5648282.1 FAD:protein FMN transferase [Christensenella tenuis]
MKRIFSILLAVCCLFAFTSCAPVQKTSEIFAMDTFITQTVYTDNGDILRQTNEITRRLEDEMSRTIETSDVCRLNAAPGQDVEISDETAEVLKISLKAAADTGGAFSPALGSVIAAWGFGTENARVPEEAELASALAAADYRTVTLDGNTANTGGAQIDLGGAVKGYALDKAAENLKAGGVKSAIISFGGSIYAIGKKPDGNSYKIGIRDPQGSENDYMATIVLDGKFVSTSGTYERGFTEDGTYYDHVLDPQTGYPVDNGLVAATALCDSGILSDIYSTALLVMGAEKGIAFAEEHGVDAFFLTGDKQVVTTDGFAEKYGLTITNREYSLG